MWIHSNLVFDFNETGILQVNRRALNGFLCDEYESEFSPTYQFQKIFWTLSWILNAFIPQIG